jgi:hypothetical protein
VFVSVAENLLRTAGYSDKVINMKTIVAHIGPDLDAITSIWLIKTFFPDWLEASLAFVPAGQTYKGFPPDDNPEIIHVDTGFGKFDHHQNADDTCAAQLVYQELKKLGKNDLALERLVNVVNDVDHFREVFFPNATADFWDISMISAIDGWRLIYAEEPIKIVQLGMETLDGIYKTFQNKVWAEKEIKDKGIEFESPWGKALGIETVNDETVHLAQKMGYTIVIRKDANKGYLRVKSLPIDKIDLESYYETMKTKDPEATWFLHASHHMILNGSSKNPAMRPTILTLNEVIKILQKK